MKKFIKEYWTFLLPIALGFALYNAPVPADMPTKGWQLFSIFLPTVIAIILAPLPMGGVAIISLLACALTNTLDFQTQALKGFSNTTSWLVLSVFFIARAFVKTNLGNRLAYYFVKITGKNTLGLAYGLSLTEVILAPFIPSNTARAGGIMLPILRSVSQALGSDPKNGTERQLGAYLFFNSFNTNLITSAMFLTAVAVNPIIQDIALGYGIKITWLTWLYATSVPCIMCLVFVPLILYVIYPPEKKELHGAQDLAKQFLKDMGPISVQEWIMIATFSMMLFLWTIGEMLWQIHPAVSGFVGVSILLVTKVLTFDDVLNESAAWHTFLWLSILVMISTYLSEFGFIDYCARHVQTTIQGYSPQITLLLCLLVFYYSHYMFASQVAHTSALYAGILSVAMVCGSKAPVAIMTLALAASLSSVTTHFGTAAAPVLFGAKYIPVGDWWRTGFFISLFHIFVLMVVA
ncbi:MAG: DASS family sodium-coupled anion symporter, partial [Alphaproteobacteria bacterium]|nr:DASS family sodium-coupled anion symporter [Alphaproteobacteria bacterium]